MYKNKLGIIEHFGKIVQFVRELEWSTVFTGISIFLAMANHDFTQLDNCAASVMVKVFSFYHKGLEFESWSRCLVCW